MSVSERSGPGESAEIRLRREPAGSTVEERREEPPGETVRPQVAMPDVFRWGLAFGFGLLCVFLATYAVYTVRGLLVLVVVALFIAVSLDPAVRWMVRRGLSRPAAVTIVFVLVLAGFVAFLAAIVPPLVSQGAKLFSQLPEYVRELPSESPTYRRLAERYQVSEKLSAYAAKLPERIASDAWGFARRFFGALVSVLTVLVLTIYFMADLPRLRRGLVRLFPRPRRPRAAEVVNVLVEKVGAYMIGNLIISVIAGVSSFLVFLLLDVQYAVALALVVAITDLIPLVGATLGAVFCTAITFFTTTEIWPATALVAVFFLVYQQVENYVIVPRIMRNTVDISSLAVLLAALVGGTVMGLVGALMAIPLAAAVKVVLTPVIEERTEPAPPAEPATP